MIDQTNNPGPEEISREEIELLLPWYVNGTLDASDFEMVEKYIAQHPEMQAQLATLREDMGEVVQVNEEITAPSGAALDRLLGQIASEAPARRSLTGEVVGLMRRVEDFLKSMSPGRLGFAAMAAAAVILLQAGVVSTMMLKTPAKGPVFHTASGSGEMSGTFVLVRFQQNVALKDVSAFLTANNVEIVEGPKQGGVFRVRVSPRKLDDSQRAAWIVKLEAEDKLFAMVLPSQ